MSMKETLSEVVDKLISGRAGKLIPACTFGGLSGWSLYKCIEEASNGRTGVAAVYGVSSLATTAITTVMATYRD